VFHMYCNRFTRTTVNICKCILTISTVSLIIQCCIHICLSFWSQPTVTKQLKAFLNCAGQESVTVGFCQLISQPHFSWSYKFGFVWWPPGLLNNFRPLSLFTSSVFLSVCLLYFSFFSLSLSLSLSLFLILSSLFLIIQGSFV